MPLSAAGLLNVMTRIPRGTSTREAVKPEQARGLLTNAIYLEDSGVEIDGVRFWGSPWTPTFMDWAFMLE